MLVPRPLITSAEKVRQKPSRRRVSLRLVNSSVPERAATWFHRIYCDDVLTALARARDSYQGRFRSFPVAGLMAISTFSAGYVETAMHSEPGRSKRAKDWRGGRRTSNSTLRARRRPKKKPIFNRPTNERVLGTFCFACPKSVKFYS